MLYSASLLKAARVFNKISQLWLGSKGGQGSLYIGARVDVVGKVQLVQHAPSLPVFRRELKTFLFRSSFPNAI